MRNQFDLIVVGSGFCGSVIARLAAEECGKRVLILEKRNHIAGNMYDEYDENGILLQKYGPHIFHTDEEWIYQFICKFGKWDPYKVFYGVELDGKCIPAPFGFRAIDMLYPKNEASKLKDRLKRAYPNSQSVSILDLLENSDESISSFAQRLYHKNYLPYAVKQWSLEPRQLDKSVIARMPIILSDRENYFDVKYEILPQKGYTALFENMLKHENITVRLNVDACEQLDFDTENGVCKRNGEFITIPIVFTGALEDIFTEEEQPLPYRSLYFEYRVMEQSSYQPTAILTYPQEHDYLRTTEFTKFMQKQFKNKTLVAFEYPVPFNRGASKGNEPYYPILTEENIAKNNQYLKKLKKIKNLFPCGRLADYKYYNMDQVIIRAFEMFRVIKAHYWSSLK